MSVRNNQPEIITDFRGLHSFDDQENLPPDAAFELLNCMITPTGSLMAMRSPANFNDALAFGTNILSGFDYDRAAGNLILFDVDIGGAGPTVSTYSTTGTTNTAERTGQADGRRWKSLNIRNVVHRVNGAEFVQMQTDTTFYANGITGPAAAPTASIVAGGAGTLNVGVTVSYAYRNSVTGHVSKMSPASGNSGPTTAPNRTLRLAVTASAQGGVDGIVLFITKDGGSVRTLLIDSTGAPQVFSNATGNIDVSVANIVYDNNTPETEFNLPPPAGAYFLFAWQDKLFLSDFRDDATKRRQWRYSGYEAIPYGNGYESWPALNIITTPNEGESAKGGIETPNGALFMSDKDSYFLSGFPTDKVSGSQNVLQITEHLQPLRWSIGTRSILTLLSTPYGEMWLDQDKRMRLWTRQGLPVEVGLPIRDQLEAIQDSDDARNMAEAVWFQHGQSGFYVLTASISGAFNNRLFICTVYVNPANGQTVFAWTVSDVLAQCLFVAEVAGKKRLFAGVLDQLRELLLMDTPGAGWGGQKRFFSLPLGNQYAFSTVHSIQMDGLNLGAATVSVANQDGTDEEFLVLEEREGATFAMAGAYGSGKRLKFAFPVSDAQRMELKNLRVNIAPRRRVI